MIREGVSLLGDDVAVPVWLGKMTNWELDRPLEKQFHKRFLLLSLVGRFAAIFKNKLAGRPRETRLKNLRIMVTNSITYSQSSLHTWGILQVRRCLSRVSSSSLYSVGRFVFPLICRCWSLWFLQPPEASLLLLSRWIRRCLSSFRVPLRPLSLGIGGKRSILRLCCLSATPHRGVLRILLRRRCMQSFLSFLIGVGFLPL